MLCWTTQKLYQIFLVIFLILLTLDTNSSIQPIQRNCFWISKKISVAYQVNSRLQYYNHLHSKTKLQYLTVDQFKSILGYYESNNNYKVVNKYGFKGKYQFSNYMIKTFAKTSNKKFLRNPYIQEETMTRVCHYYVQYIYRNNLHKHINKEVGGVYITMESLLLGMHFSPTYLRKYLKSNGEINGSDGYINIRDYMKRFENRGIDSTIYILKCS